jgi:hypothetical protein
MKPISVPLSAAELTVPRCYFRYTHSDERYVVYAFEVTTELCMETTVFDLECGSVGYHLPIACGIIVLRPT